MVLNYKETTITYFQVDTEWYQITEELDEILSNIGIACNTHIQGEGKRKERFITIPCAFDIETSKIEYVENKRNVRHSYMYVWQLSISDLNIIGRKWEEATQVFNYIVSKISSFDDDTRLICWVHNLKYESSFMLPRYYKDITNGFFMDKHECVYFDYKDVLRFQDSMLISGCSLESTGEQYQLKHRKAKTNGVSDLDYKKVRNSKTPLTEQELYYCLLDTIVLCDFAEVIYSRLVKENFGKIPLTKTQLVLNAIYESLGTEKLKAMRTWRPQYDEYIQMSRWLYRGGFVHSNAVSSGIILDNVDSIDFTSSYPATIVHDYFPSSRFYKRKITNKKDFYYYLNNRCCWFRACFTNVKAKTTHTIESKSKLEYYEKGVFDNGRLYSADKIVVQFTELDFEIFNLFYSYEEMSLDFFKVAYRGRMPQEIIDTMLSWYKTKAILKSTGKKETLDYTLSKEKINSTYGAFVKHINIENWDYINGQWQLAEGNPKEIYDKTNNKLRLLPYQVGIYITAHSRAKLLRMLYKIGIDGRYCDTDSIKCTNIEKYIKYIDAYNNDIEKKNKLLIGDDPLTNDLGMFDKNDGHYSKFMSLRAKAYAYIDKEDGKFHSTISGLKKGVIKDFDTFKDGTQLEKEYCNKITSCYNEEYHEDKITDYLGVTEVMGEYGSCCLYEVGFNISISDDYRDFLSKHFGRKKL